MFAVTGPAERLTEAFRISELARFSELAREGCEFVFVDYRRVPMASRIAAAVETVCVCKAVSRRGTQTPAIFQDRIIIFTFVFRVINCFDNS